MLIQHKELTRPLVLIGHCLGGLIIKQVCMLLHLGRPRSLIDSHRLSFWRLMILATIEGRSIAPR